MSGLDDHDLLARYARENSEAAFAALAERHVNLVYATALRSVGNAHAAQEISQAVFIILANKAEKLSRRVVLSGWLYQTTRLTAANFLRGEIRRQKREMEAFMRSTLEEPSENPAWPQIAPLLDDALGKLGERDRNAIVLRFFENKNLREVGRALGASEDAAKMRVNRALEKLRKIFGKRGLRLTTAIIAAAVSVNAAPAAPVGLAATITATVAKGAMISGSTLTLIKGALKIMAWTKMKMAVAVGVGILLAAGTTVVVEKISQRNLSPSDLSWADNPKYWALDSMVLDRLPAGVFIFRPTKFAHDGGSVWINGRMSAKNNSVNELVNYAYGSGYTRTIFPQDLPEERFDVMSTMRGGYGDLLKNELKTRFGLTAHSEQRMAEVLLLRVQNPNPPNLKPHGSGNLNSSWIGGDQSVVLKNYDLGGFFSYVESRLGTPIINQTDFQGRYDLEINWRTNSGETEKEALRRALSNQLGLELVPTNMPIEILVVEKAK